MECKDKLKDYGEIYVVKCLANGKHYVGQAQLLTGKDLRHYGTHGRWIGHLYEARTGRKTCRYLNHAIQKYGSDNFEVTPVLTCKIEDLTKYEDMFMELYNSMVDNGNGYNLRSAGRCGRASAETLKKKSESMKGEKHPQYGKPIKDEVKKKISQTNIDKMVRYDKDGTTRLPKFMKYVNWATEEGYHIVSHPGCKQKKFVTTNRDNDLEKVILEKRAEALAYLIALDGKIINK